MKKVIEPAKAMERLISNLLISYSNYSPKKDGIMQLRFTDKFDELDCYIVFNGNSLTLEYGIGYGIDLELKCLFKNWMDLVEGRLNLTWGVLSGKLKFMGDITFLDVFLIRKMRTDVHYFGECIDEFETNPSQNWCLPKRVMIINNSPHGGVKYIDACIKALKEGIESVGGIDVEIIRLAKIRINKCVGCEMCRTAEDRHCIFNGEDDFEMFYNRVQEMDLVIYAFPLYTDGIPIILKNYYERSVRKSYLCVNQLHRSLPNYEKKRSMFVLGCCGYPGMRLFKDVKLYFGEMSRTAHTPIVGELYRSGGVYLFSNPLAYNIRKDILNGLKKCGREVVMTGKLSKKNKIQVERRLGSISRLRCTISYFRCGRVYDNREGD